MLKNTNVQAEAKAIREQIIHDPDKGVPRRIERDDVRVTTDPQEFVDDPRKVWFHDRIRGVVFIRGREGEELPHRYLKHVERKVKVKFLKKALRRARP